MEVKDIVLFERKCAHRKCNAKFKVMKKSKQKYCSMLCAGLELPFIQVPNYIKGYDSRGFRSASEAEQSEDESD
jgi:hypothetical protein